MTRLALIARADRGGLGSQTLELHRHLDPTRTLVVDLGRKARGLTDRHRYGHERDVRRTRGLPTRQDIDWLLADTDIVWTVETHYGKWLAERANARQIPVVLQANPELYNPTESAGAIVVLPTPWEAHRLPARAILPMPVATDRLERRDIREVRTFVHHAAPAFHDRNGTLLVLAALEHVTADCTVIIRAPADADIPSRIGRVDVLHNIIETADYWECWPEHADALLLPRRYGGLSLPMNEAAALGLPIITLDLPPQNQWVHPSTRVPLSKLERPPTPVPMKGGIFDVHDANPVDIAERIDWLVADPELARAAAQTSGDYGQTISWERLLPVYRELIEDVAHADQFVRTGW